MWKCTTHTRFTCVCCSYFPLALCLPLFNWCAQDHKHSHYGIFLSVNREATRLEPVVILEVSCEVVQEEGTNEVERVYVEDGNAYVTGTMKKEDPEDRESED